MSMGSRNTTPRSPYYSLVYSALLMMVIGIAEYSMGNPSGGTAFVVFGGLLFLLRWRLVKRR